MQSISDMNMKDFKTIVRDEVDKIIESVSLDITHSSQTTRKTLSEGLAYHLENSVPLSDNVYRPGTKEFFHLVNEARQLWTW